MVVIHKAGTSGNWMGRTVRVAVERWVSGLEERRNIEVENM